MSADEEAAAEDDLFLPPEARRRAKKLDMEFSADAGRDAEHEDSAELSRVSRPAWTRPLLSPLYLLTAGLEGAIGWRGLSTHYF
jgi:hypothetical protein